MHYKKAFATLAVSLFISSSCFAAESNPLYSCKTVQDINNTHNKNSKLNFINRTMPDYVANKYAWKHEVKSKLNWINQNTPTAGSLLIFNSMNMICDTMPADYDPIHDAIEDIYFFTINQVFKETQPKQ